MKDNFVAQAQRNAADFIAGRVCNVLPQASWSHAVLKIGALPALTQEQRMEVNALSTALVSGSDIERMMLLSQVSKIEMLGDDDLESLVGIAAAIQLLSSSR